jgi:predicted negative regulator of RcsB-dependent stress response
MSTILKLGDGLTAVARSLLRIGEIGAAQPIAEQAVRTLMVAKVDDWRLHHSRAMLSSIMIAAGDKDKAVARLRACVANLRQQEKKSRTISAI